MDKRIVKTRTAIFNAVFEISADKDLDKISVVELCEKAGINKSTFYLHYTSIDDCFQKCFGFFTDKTTPMLPTRQRRPLTKCLMLLRTIWS